MRTIAVCGLLSDIQRHTIGKHVGCILGTWEKDRETGQNVSIWGIWVGTLRKLFTLFYNLLVSLNGCQNEKVKNVRPFGYA